MAAALADWRESHPDLETDAYGCALRVIRAGRLLDEEVRSVISRYGVGVRGDSEVLLALRRGHPKPRRPGELADWGMVTSAGMAGRLDRLEQLGLLGRHHGLEDRRTINVSLTEHGLATADAIIEAVQLHMSALLSDGLGSGVQAVSELIRPLLVALGDRPRR